MKFKKKDLFAVGGALILLMIGIGLLSFPTIAADKVNTLTLFYGIMCVYAIIYCIMYFVTRKEGDYELLFMTLISTIAGTSGILFNTENTPIVLSLTLICWVALASIIKLIKVDYLMDRNNNMWYVKLILFAAFILAGILTSINLYYSITIQTLMLGFFFLINGMLEVAFPLLDVFYLRNIEQAEKNKEKEIKEEQKADNLNKGGEVLQKEAQVISTLIEKPKTNSIEKPKPNNKPKPKQNPNQKPKPNQNQKSNPNQNNASKKKNKNKKKNNQNPNQKQNPNQNKGENKK